MRGDKMDETRAIYGTTTEAIVTFVSATGQEKSIKIPEAKDESAIYSYANAFANLATNSDTYVIGFPSESADGSFDVPARVKIDVVTTTRTNVYGGNL